MNHYLKITFVSVALLLSACDSNDDDTTASVTPNENAVTEDNADVDDNTDENLTTDGNTTPDENTTPADNSETADNTETVENTENSENASSPIAGTWQLACYRDTDLPAELEPQYRTTRITFTGGLTGNFTSEFSQHSNQDCTSSPVAENSGTLAGTYSIGNQLTSNEGMEVTELDVMTDSLTPLGEETISPVVVQALVLDIFVIDNNTLFFGIHENPDADPPVRATSINFTEPFSMQP